MYIGIISRGRGREAKAAGGEAHSRHRKSKNAHSRPGSDHPGESPGEVGEARKSPLQPHSPGARKPPTAEAPQKARKTLFYAPEAAGGGNPGKSPGSREKPEIMHISGNPGGG